MYWFKTELKKQLLDGRKQRYVAKVTGLTEPTIVNVLSGKIGARKTTAYCIVKCCQEDAEIEDYFEVKGE